LVSCRALSIVADAKLRGMDMISQRISTAVDQARP
jgi:hypothetical protein